MDCVEALCSAICIVLGDGVEPPYGVQALQDMASALRPTIPVVKSPMRVRASNAQAAGRGQQGGEMDLQELLMQSETMQKHLDPRNRTPPRRGQALPHVVGDMVSAASRLVQDAENDFKEVTAARLFESMDRNGDGVIDRREFRAAYQASGGLPSPRSVSPDRRVIVVPPKVAAASKKRTKKTSQKTREKASNKKRIISTKSKTVMKAVGTGGGQKLKPDSPMAILEQAHQQKLHWQKSQESSDKRLARSMMTLDKMNAKLGR